MSQIYPILVHVPHETLRTLKVELPKYRCVTIKYKDGDTTNVKTWDFANKELKASHDFGIHLNEVHTQSEETVVIKVTIWGAEVEDLVYADKVSTYPAYLFLAEGETFTAETAVFQDIMVPTFQDNRIKEVDALSRWRSLKLDIISRGVGYFDGDPKVLEKLSHILRAVDKYLCDLALDPNVEPLVVEEYALAACALPLDIETPDAFIRAVLNLYHFPAKPAIWYKNGKLTRITNLDRTSEDVPEEYNSTDPGILELNRKGSVSFDSTPPKVAQTIRAALTDPDGSVKNVRYSWQIKDPHWKFLNRSNMSYVPRLQDVGKELRVFVEYEDRYATENSIVSDSTGRVTN